MLFRSNVVIEFGRSTAVTTFGTIGVKAWIYRGDIIPERGEAPAQPAGRTA